MNYEFSEKERRSIAIVFDWKIRQEYIMILNEYGDEYGELSGNEWYEYIDGSYFDYDYQYIGKRQAADLAYWAENYFLINARPDDVTKKLVKSISQEAIDEFYGYCDSNNITMDDLVKYIVRQLSLSDDGLFESDDIDEIKEVIDEDLEPLGITITKKLIKGLFMEAYKKLVECE